MEHFNTYVLSHYAFDLLAVLFWITGAMIFLTGVCLLGGYDGILRCFEGLTHRSSMRSVQSAADDREIQHIERRHLRWIGLAFIIGAIYALLGLITGFETATLLHVFGVKASIFAPVFWAVECIRWLLIAGNIFALVAGLIISIFPAAFIFLENRSGPWFSAQRAKQDHEKKKFTLDDWVAERPHTVGWIIIVAGAVPMGDFGVMLLGIR